MFMTEMSAMAALAEMAEMAEMAATAAMAAMAIIAAMAAMAAMAASICIQISKRKTMYIGRNAQNLKKLAPGISTSTLSLKELLSELTNCCTMDPMVMDMDSTL